MRGREDSVRHARWPTRRCAGRRPEGGRRRFPILRSFKYVEGKWAPPLRRWVQTFHPRGKSPGCFTGVPAGAMDIGHRRDAADEGCRQPCANPVPMRSSRLTAGKTLGRKGTAPPSSMCARLRRSSSARRRKGSRVPPLVGPDHVAGVLGVPSVARSAAGRVTAARLPVPGADPSTTGSAQIPAPTGPSRHADPGPPRRTAGTSGQITTFAVHPALARPALPSPQGLSTLRLAATRPPPERASAGGHRASVCAALPVRARPVPTQSRTALPQNSLKTLDAAVPTPVSVARSVSLRLTCPRAGETSIARGPGSALGPRPWRGVGSPSHGEAVPRAPRTKAPETPRARSVRFAPAAGTARRPRPTRLWAVKTVRSLAGVATAQSARAVGRCIAAEAPRIEVQLWYRAPERAKHLATFCILCDVARSAESRPVGCRLPGLAQFDRAPARASAVPTTWRMA